MLRKTSEQILSWQSRASSHWTNFKWTAQNRTELTARSFFMNRNRSGDWCLFVCLFFMVLGGLYDRSSSTVPSMVSTTIWLNFAATCRATHFTDNGGQALGSPSSGIAESLWLSFWGEKGGRYMCKVRTHALRRWITLATLRKAEAIRYYYERSHGRCMIDFIGRALGT